MPAAEKTNDDSSSPMAPMTLMATDGLRYTLGGPSRGLSLTVFFKTSCPACRLTFGYLERLHQGYRHAGLSLLAVSQDGMDDTLSFAAEGGCTFPFLLDAHYEASRTYDIQFVPTLVLHDKRGVVLHRSESFFKEDLNQIARLVAEQTQTEPVEVAPAGDGKPPFKPG
jgi:peroxiredoxin